MLISITQILKDMLAYRTRLMLTIIAVAWGTFSIASMLAVGEGLRLTFGQVISNSGMGALVVRGQASTSAFRGLSAGIPIKLSHDDFTTLKQATTNKAIVSSETTTQARLNNKKLSWSGNITAVDPEYATIHGTNLMPGGRFINVNDFKQSCRVIVLGNRASQKLFLPGENPIGQTVLVGTKSFLVIGVMRETLQFVTYGMPDDFNSWIPTSTYQALTNSREYTDFIVAPINGTLMPMLKQQVQHVLANLHNVDPGDPGILNFLDLQEQQQKVNMFFVGMEIFLGIIGGLTLVVAGAGIANVMYVAVTRATREIGIRMAVGARSYHILTHYIVEAVLTTFIGGIIGLLLTKILLFILGAIPMQPSLLKYLGSPHPVLSLNVVFIVIITLGVVGLLAGLFPARKASKIDPARALRYE